jgi:CheY-like chemotaxis protein
MRPRLTLWTRGRSAPPGEDGPVVLLADPDRLRGALIAAALEDAAIGVVWVAHGDEALELAEKQLFAAFVVNPSLRTSQRALVFQSLSIKSFDVPFVFTGSSAAAVHRVADQTPVPVIVARVRASLDRQLESGNARSTSGRPLATRKWS